MISSYDLANALRDRYGDEGVDTIGDGAGALEDGEPDVHAPPFLSEHQFPGRICRAFELNALAAGASLAFDCEVEPDYWLISLVPAANTGLSVFLDQTPGGVPHARLGSGGMARLPGRLQFLSVTNTGSAAVSGTVLALRGCGPYIEVLGGSS